MVNENLKAVCNHLEHTADCDELSAVMRLVADAYKAGWERVKRGKLTAFSPGQTVDVEVRDGLVRGVVQKLSKSTAVVLTDTGELWRVSPLLLRAVASTQEVVQ